LTKTRLRLGAPTEILRKPRRSGASVKCARPRDATGPLRISSRAAKPAAGPGWVHEIKHDGYRLIVRRDGDTVRLFTRRGHDWMERYPAIATAAGKLPAKSFTMDGEAVVTGADDVAVFGALHRRHKASDAILYAFDLLDLDGADLRPLPLGERKAKLTRLLARKPAGIVLNEQPTKSAPPCSCTPASSGSKASFRSGWARHTGQARRGTGSR